MRRFATLGLGVLLLGGCAVASDAGDDPSDEQGPTTATADEALHTTFRGPRNVGGSHSGPAQILTDATTAYWLNGSLGFAPYTTSITKAAKTGFGARTTVADLGNEEPRGMVLSGSTLYWATATRVGAVNVDGSGFRIIASGLSVTAQSISQDATYVYYATGGVIQRVPKAGGAPFAYAPLFNNVRELVVNGGDLYVIDDVSSASAGGSISRVSTSTGTRVFLATAQARPRFLAVSGDYVYWGNRGVLSDCCEYQNYTDVDLRRVLKVGGSVTTIRNLTTTLNGLAVTSEHVYWSEGTLGVGNVRRIPRSGGTSTYVVTNEGRTTALAADADGVVYTRADSDGDGGLLKFIPRADIRGSQCTTTPARAGDAVAPLGLSVTGTWIYFTEPGNALIKRLWRNGSSQSEVVASGHPSAFALIANEHSLYWLQNSGGTSWEAWHHFINGLGAEPYMSGTGLASDLATDGRNHFVVERDGSVFTGTVGVGTQRLLTQVDGTAERLSLSTSYVYVSHTTSTGAAAVSRVSKTAPSGTAPRRIVTVTGRTAGDVVYDNDYVYLVTFSGTSHSLVRAPSVGGTAQTLWTGSARPYELSATDNYVYMTTNAATLIRVNKTGGFTTLSDRAGTAAELDTDGKCVSFAVRTSSGGEIVKVAE